MSKAPNVVAKAVLEGNDACAVSVLGAVKKLFGEEFVEWESETFRLEFHYRNINILDENFNALMAGISIIQTPSFYYDANVFENVCVAFNMKSPQFDIIHELSPAQIAWGVAQAQAIIETFATYDVPEELTRNERFDYEPISFTAASCIHAGMVTAPEELDFARERVEELTNAHETFVSHVKKEWDKLDKNSLEEHSYSEDAVGVQLALMATIPLYIKDQTSALKFQSELLGG